jgi:hypothetical protein
MRKVMIRHRAREWTALVAAGAALFGVAANTRAETIGGLVIAKNLATGIDDATGQKIPSRIHDTDWSWNGPTTTVYLWAEDDPGIPEGFLDDVASPCSRWLYFADTPAAAFVFELQVDLSDFDAATARIEGLRVAADNWVQSVAVNGTPVFEQPPPSGPGTGFENCRFRLSGGLI